MPGVGTFILEDGKFKNNVCPNEGYESLQYSERYLKLFLFNLIVDNLGGQAPHWQVLRFEFQFFITKTLDLTIF